MKKYLWLGLLCAWSGWVHAQSVEVAMPSSDLLREINARIIPAADCDKNSCVSLEKINVIKKDKDNFTIEWQWNARKAVAVPLPWSEEAMKFSSMDLNGKPYYGAMKSPEGQYLVALPSGPSLLKLNFNLIKSEIILPLNQIPGFYSDTAFARFSLQNNTLFLKLRADEQVVGKNKETEKQAKERVEFSPITLPLVQIEREFLLTRDGWVVSNKIFLQGESSRPVIIDLPLLANEVVTETGFKIEGEKEPHLSLNLSVGEVITWTSRIKENGLLKLEAKGNFIQSWWVANDGFFSLKTNGLPVSSRKTQGLLWEGYHPGLGEKLEIKSELLSYEKGLNKAIFSSDVKVGVNESGQHMLWVARLLTTVGGPAVIVMPEGYTYDSLTLNEKMVVPQISGQKIAAEFLAGENKLTLKLKNVNSPWFSNLTAPYFEGVTNANEKVEWGGNLLDDNNNNFTVIDHRADRWVLALGGGQSHPSIWWWAVVISFAILSLFIKFIPFIPLKVRDWLFLSLGLSTIAWTGIVWVIVWFVGMGARKNWAANSSSDWTLSKWNKLLQVCLLLLTLFFIWTIVLAAYGGLMHATDLLVSGGLYSINWYSPESGVGGTPWVFSTPLWFYRLLMGVWAFWLAWKMLDWLKWGWGCYSQGGYWPPAVKKEKKNSVEENKI